MAEAAVVYGGNTSVSPCSTSELCPGVPIVEVELEWVRLVELKDLKVKQASLSLPVALISDHFTALN